MNQGFFVGRIGQDAEVRYTQSGKAVCSVSLAIDNGKDKDSGQPRPPTWVKVTVWEKRAVSLAPHLTKGKMIAVSGPVSVESWVGKQDGQAQARIVCTLRELKFCGGPKAEGDQAAPAQQPASSGITDEDFPF